MRVEFITDTRCGGVRALAVVCAVLLAATAPLAAQHKLTGPAILPMAPLLTVSEEWLGRVAPVLEPSHVVVAATSDPFAQVADQVSAISLPDADIEWTTTIGEPNSSLATGDGLIFATSANKISALEDGLGQPKWSISTKANRPPIWRAGWLFVTTETDKYRREFPLFFSNHPSTMFSTDATEILTAYRTSDGSKVWDYDVRAALTAPPAVDGAQIVLALTTRQIRSIDALTGQPQWNKSLPDLPDTPLLVEHRIYVGTADRQFHCLSADHGTELWPAVANRMARTFGSPAVDEHHLYLVGVDSVLNAIDRGNGAVRWHQSLPARPLAGPTVQDGVVFLPLGTGVVQLFMSDDTLAGTLSLAVPDVSAQFSVDPPFAILGRAPNARIATIMTSAQLATLTVYEKVRLDVATTYSGAGLTVTWPPLTGPLLTLR